MIAQNSPNQQDPDQDQRSNANMEDSTAKKIESLRGQLLFERSVSKTARQRADELAKRVVELEEQLKIVSIQRKKAEMATADVLAILENHGIGELSDEFDSSSDQEEINCESQVSNNSPEESSAGSKTRRNHADEYSGSEPESSVPGRSLSWKSGKDSSHAREKKYTDSSSRRRSSFASSTSASPRHRTGKSCRQIRRRETRLALEESQTDDSKLASQENGIAICQEGFPICSDIRPGIRRENSQNQDTNVFVEGPVSGDLENERIDAIGSNYLNRSNKDMERALEYQAQLIEQYEEEEKAQREWEEKFRENNNSSLDSCELGNHSNVTEERDETRSQAPSCANGFVSTCDEESKSKVEVASVVKEPCKSQSGGFQAHSFVGYSQDQKSLSIMSHKSPASDLVYPVGTGQHDQQCSGCNHGLLSHGYHKSSCLKGHNQNRLAEVFPSHEGSNLYKEESFGSKKEHHALMPYEVPNKLGPVLEALQQAKLSLKHKVNGLPTVNGSAVGGAIEFSVGDKAEVPVGCAGLFRVPSDFHLEASNEASVLGLNSRLSLTNYYPDPGNALTAADRFFTSQYTQSRSSVPSGDKHLTFPTNLYMESRPKVPTWGPLETWPRYSSHKPYLGPTLNTSVPPSSRYGYNDTSLDKSLASSTYLYPSYPFNPDLVRQMPPNERQKHISTQHIASGQDEMAPSDDFPISGDHSHSHMHRW